MPLPINAFTISPEKTITTKDYKYIIGWYSHETYGEKCYRISKYLKANNYFIGHFVIVPDDIETVKEAIHETLFLEKEVD